MRQANSKKRDSEETSESNNAVAQKADESAAKRRVAGTGGVFQRHDSRFLYISYRDVSGKRARRAPSRNRERSRKTSCATASARLNGALLSAK